MLNIFSKGDEIAQELISTRCQRGAEIARKLRFPERVAEVFTVSTNISTGQGRPQQLAGEAIPLFSRIALLAQVIDVFHNGGGVAAAQAEVRRAQRQLV